MKIEEQNLEKINQDFSEMTNKLEPLKVASAYNSQLMILQYRQKNKPDSVNVLDFTILAALQKQIPAVPINRTAEINANEGRKRICDCDVVICPSCNKRLRVKYKGRYCDKCGQRLKWDVAEKI